MQGVTLNSLGVILHPPVWAVVLTCCLGAVIVLAVLLNSIQYKPRAGAAG